MKDFSARADVPRPFILGLTGSIGTGKTTTASFFRRLKVPVQDSDEEVHWLLKEDETVRRQVLRRFPACGVSGEIDRTLLGGIVFKDPGALKELESILHPRVRSRHELFIQSHQRQKTPGLVLDIPLLFEAGYEAMCDKVLVTTCDPALQQERVLKRPGMSLEKFHKILDNQLERAYKQERADYLLETSQGRRQTFRQLRLILEDLRPVCLARGAGLIPPSPLITKGKSDA